MITIMVIVVVISPIIYYLATGKMTPLLPVFLPEMIASTLNGFILMVYVQSAALITEMTVLYAFDTLIAVLFVNMLVVASVIAKSIAEMQCWLKQSNYSPKQSKQQLIQIILMHNKYNE